MGAEWLWRLRCLDCENSANYNNPPIGATLLGRNIPMRLIRTGALSRPRARQLRCTNRPSARFDGLPLKVSDCGAISCLPGAFPRMGFGNSRGGVLTSPGGKSPGVPGKAAIHTTPVSLVCLIGGDFSTLNLS